MEEAKWVSRLSTPCPWREGSRDIRGITGRSGSCPSPMSDRLGPSPTPGPDASLERARFICRCRTGAWQPKISYQAEKVETEKKTQQEKFSGCSFAPCEGLRLSERPAYGLNWVAELAWLTLGLHNTNRSPCMQSCKQCRVITC